MRDLSVAVSVLDVRLVRAAPLCVTTGCRTDRMDNMSIHQRHIISLCGDVYIEFCHHILNWNHV